jgi:Tol biopolymer transport system component/DNA-binding winged helix-turn-helix (wHTH) protein
VPNPRSARRIRFGPFELDVRTNELLKHGSRIRVRDQPIHILRALLERPGDVVTRDEIRERLWPADTFVDFERGVNSAVRRLREALGDSADAPTYIETLPRLGYRFIGTIEDDDTVAPTVPAPIEPPHAPVVVSAPSDDAPSVAPAVVARTISAWRRWIVVAVALLLLTISAIALSDTWSPRPSPLPAAWSDPTRLTFANGLQMNPSFSRDGTWLTYAGNQTGDFDIWTQRLAGGKPAGNPVRVTTHAADDWQPDWSPIDDTIVFRSERGAGGLFLVPATGGVETPLTDFGYRPQWSSDGRFILFSQYVVAGLTSALYVVDPHQRAPRQLTSPRVTGGFGWRPGSHEVVVLGGFRLPFNISLISVDADTQQRIVWTFDEQVIDRFREQVMILPGERLAWSADGRAIYFVGESHGLRRVWRIDVDAPAHRVVGGPTRVTGTSRDANDFALSRDGRQIAFDGSARAAQLWAYELDGAGGVRPGRETPASLEAVHAEAPDLSPDGHWLISLQSQPGSRQRTEAVARDMTTGHERVLRPFDDDRENVAFLRWSADGTRLSYLDFVQQPVKTLSDQVRLLDPATGHEDALTSPHNANATASDLPSGWMPDGRAIVASGTRYVDGHDSIVLLPLASAPHAETSPTIVTSVRNPSRFYQVSASPDGRWIVFRAADVSGQIGSSQVVVVSAHARGSDETSWIVAAGQKGWSVDKPRWSASGDRIYFSVTDGGLFSIWSIGFDSVNGRVIGERRQTNLALDSPAAHIQPDIREFELGMGGRYLVVPVVRPKGGIWMMER